MIQTDEQLKSTQEALAKLEEGMASLNRKKDTMHTDWLLRMAEPFVDQNRQLRAEIDAYTGIAAAEIEVAQVGKQRVG